MSANVWKWQETIEIALEGVDIDGLTVPVVLSLIHVESRGNPRARRVGSQFCGLLQMGRMAGIDVGMEDDGNDTTKPLLDNPIASIVAFVAYVERYRARLVDGNNRDRSIATLWKGGPGTANYIKQLTENEHDLTFGECVSAAQAAKRIPNLREYLRRYDEAFAIYGAD